MNLVILESTQSHAVIKMDGVCTTLVSAMGDGIGYVPIITMRNKDVGKTENKNSDRVE